MTCTNHHRRLSRVLSLTFPLTVLAGCHSSPVGPEGSSVGAEQALAEAQASYAELKTIIEGCFTGFKDCVRDAGADRAVCRDALESCLPAHAPSPSRCQARDAGSDPGESADGGAPADVDGGVVEPPPWPGEDPGRGGAPASAVDGGVVEPPPLPGEGGAPASAADGGEAGDPAENTDDEAYERHARTEVAHGMGRKGPPRCDELPLTLPAELRACRDQLKECLSTTDDGQPCSEAHHECIKAAAAGAFERYCGRAQAACEAGAIPVKACAHITDRCAQGVDAG